ncbi:uncharacterized protein [Parasteatoda tepidariorum]|uniref:uncharacterized protein isoform X3 n=1 Tax=Parasteatoda tepidariorum TaxID=114398 RepID=UPI001C71FDFE|nr:uncharacterized protein LOC107451898 isoform X3 [Parasteatoda tepidariorum]
MNEYSGNSSCRNFIMLSRKMHLLFLRYILGGRLRAPPEADLTYLISTFQYGAKTDRRALQSKFKSWAKRMVVENYKLKLICSGKEIIPIEDSCKIVMDIHFQGHQSISQVIQQIQEKYTWTKKNFGMDRVMIVDFILKNCNNLDCIRAIESNEFMRNYQREDYFKDMMLSSDPGICNIYNQMQQGSVSMANPSTFYGLTKGHPLSSSSSDIENSFSSDLKITNVRSIKPVPDNLAKGTLSKGIPKNFEIGLQKTTTSIREMSYTKSDDNKLKTQKSLRVIPRSFRKPKNINDFNALLRAAEQFSNYPAVLYNPKTKFLGNFGLVPKRICSKKTLTKVEKEKKRKKIQDRQNMIYHQNRKNLRDRNKLNKIKLKEMERRAYLENFKRNSVDRLCKMVSKSSSGTMSNYSNSAISNSTESNDVISSADDSEIEIVEIVPKIDGPEVIDIVSSDDENNFENCSFKPKDSSRDVTILTNGNKTMNVESNLKRNETMSSLKKCKDDGLKPNQQSKDSPGSTSSTLKSETQNRFCSIFKQPYLLPPKSKGEVAILPSLQCRPPLSIQNKIAGSLNAQSSNPVKLSKAFMQGKKSILQPISSVMGRKSSNMQRLLTSGIANKIPRDINVYLVKKQPSGVIKMVPCNRVVTTNNESLQYVKEASPISVINSGRCVDIPTKTKYRAILPVPDRVLELNRLKVLDENKLLIDEEMAKLSKWIGGMKSTVARTYFQLNVQKSKQRLESHVNAAIAIVKNIRRKLWEIEKLEEQVNSMSNDTKTLI